MLYKWNKQNAKIYNMWQYVPYLYHGRRPHVYVSNSLDYVICVYKVDWI